MKKRAPRYYTIIACGNTLGERLESFAAVGKIQSYCGDNKRKEHNGDFDGMSIKIFGGKHQIKLVASAEYIDGRRSNFVTPDKQPIQDLYGYLTIWR